MRVSLDSELGHVTWLGRGPHENYWDRKRSAMMGVWRSTVEDLFVPYIVPSENGGKADCEVWLARVCMCTDPEMTLLRHCLSKMYGK